MSAHELAGVAGKELRRAIRATESAVPQLAPQLEENPLAIRDVLLGAMALSEQPPGTEQIFSKAERTVIFSATAQGLDKAMIAGRGRTSRFKETPKGTDVLDIWRHFYDATKDFRASEPWTGPAGARFDDLVDAHMEWQEQIPTTHINLDPAHYSQALIGEPLSVNLRAYNRFLDRHTKGVSTDKRQQYAHDLAYLPLSRASLNAEGFADEDPILDGLSLLRGEIVELPSGRATFLSNDPVAWRKVFPRAPEDAMPTLKCPFHQAKSPDEPTPLENLFHASIAAGLE